MPHILAKDLNTLYVKLMVRLVSTGLQMFQEHLILVNLHVHINEEK